MADETQVPVKAPDSAVSTREPRAMLNELQADVERWWNRAWTSFPRPWSGNAQSTSGAWLPTTDVYRQNGDLVVKAEVPGIQKEDVKVTLEGGDLVIQGERKEEHEVKEGDYYRMERSYGSFYRRVTLPSGIQPESIKATFKDGVLEVRVPVPAEPAPEASQIKID